MRGLVRDSHLPFVSPVVVMRAVEAAGLGHVGPSGPRALVLAPCLVPAGSRGPRGKPLACPRRRGIRKGGR